ncbi:hypothetical protein EBT25_19115 [bacterium]|nr:hypothetical protein [bacterium]
MNQSIFPDRPLPQSTGRVDLVNSQNGAAYNLYKEYDARRQGVRGTFAGEAIMNIHEKNELNEIFFSQRNIDLLQDAIRYAVYQKSCGKYVIDRQSENELKVIMRATYLEYGNYTSYNVLDQVKALNARVIDYCVGRILPEIGMYDYYKKDISRLPDPMSRGQFVSSKGEKVNEIKGFF